MSISESQIYIEFLRYCLDTSRVIPRSVADINWHALLLFAREQAIVGIYWQGIVTPPNLPDGEEPFYGNKPTDDDIMEWMADIQDITSQNKLVDEAACFTANKFEKKGFPNCLLKGQGNALYYPTPNLRQSGDIDIYLKCKDNDAIEYVRRFLPDARAIYHHIDFVDIDGVNVEVHYRPSWLNNPIYNSRIQKWYLEHSKSETSKLGFQVPNPAFNAVFQLNHIYMHVLKEGIGLRQIIDYYYLLQLINKRSEDKAAIAKAIKHVGMRKIASGLSWVLCDLLGLDEKYLLIPGNKRYGKFLLQEMIDGGNFGKFSDEDHSADGSLAHNVKRIKRDLRMAKYFPSECIFEPYFRVYHYLWRHNHNKGLKQE